MTVIAVLARVTSECHVGLCPATDQRKRGEGARNDGDEKAACGSDVGVAVEILVRNWAALLLTLLLSLSAATARADVPVRRLPSLPGTSEYGVAAQATGAAWGSDADNERRCHILFGLDHDSVTLTVGLPARTDRAEAEAWLRQLDASLGWRGSRLYSYQDAHQLRIRIEGQLQTDEVWPFRRRAILDLRRVYQRLQRRSPQPVLLGIQVTDATVAMVDTPPQARVRLGNAEYLFYSSLTAPVALLALTYGLSARQVAALLMVGLLGLLFPIGPLWAYRRYRVSPADLSADTRVRDYERWQRGVRIAGLVGTYGAFMVLCWRLVPHFFIPSMPTVVPLWWWYGALEQHFPLLLPERDAHAEPAAPPPVLVTLGWGVLTAIVMFLPSAFGVQTLGMVLQWLPLVFAGCLVAAIVLGCLAGWYSTRAQPGRVRPGTPDAE